MPFPPLLKRTKLPNTGKFCRSKNYGIAEANQQFFTDKITDGLIIEQNSGIKNGIFVILCPDKPF